MNSTSNQFFFLSVFTIESIVYRYIKGILGSKKIYSPSHLRWNLKRKNNLFQFRIFLHWNGGHISGYFKTLNRLQLLRRSSRSANAREIWIDFSCDSVCSCMDCKRMEMWRIWVSIILGLLKWHFSFFWSNKIIIGRN